MNKSEAAAITADLFKHYPTVIEWHVTADGQAFEKKHDAENHARSFTLPVNQSIITVSKEDGAGEATAVVNIAPVLVVPQGTIVKIDTGGAEEGQSDYTITATDLESNPSLAEQGLQEDDIIKVPAKEMEATGENVNEPSTIAPPNNTEAEELEKAKVALAEATQFAGAKAQEYNDAPAKKRGQAKIALNKANKALTEAKEAVGALTQKAK